MAFSTVAEKTTRVQNVGRKQFFRLSLTAETTVALAALGSDIISVIVQMADRTAGQPTITISGKTVTLTWSAATTDTVFVEITSF